MGVRENVTGGHKSINTDHALIHAGRAFSFSKKFSIAAAGISYVQIKTPASKYVHLKPIKVSSDGPKIDVAFIEAPTVTDGTNAVALVNRNRPMASAYTFGTLAYDNPTSVSSGTIIEADYIGGGSGGTPVAATIGGALNNDNEFVLKQSTSYLLKITNSGASTAAVQANFFGYEEDSAN